jgi:hypothetical protein
MSRGYHLFLALRTDDCTRSHSTPYLQVDAVAAFQVHIHLLVNVRVPRLSVGCARALDIIILRGRCEANDGGRSLSYALESQDTDSSND